MATFNVVTGEKKDKLFKLQSLGKTKAMSDIMTALARINKNDTDAEAGNWASFKEAFKDFGFTVVYDRNMAILITALFAAIAQSGFSDLRTWAKNAISKTTAANKGNKNIGIEKGDQINLGQALLNGDGKAVHDILAQSGAQNMLENTIGIDHSCAVKFLNRVKKITPWRLSGSTKALGIVRDAFKQMTNEDYDYVIPEKTSQGDEKEKAKQGPDKTSQQKESQETTPEAPPSATTPRPQPAPKPATITPQRMDSSPSSAQDSSPSTAMAAAASNSQQQQTQPALQPQQTQPAPKAQKPPAATPSKSTPATLETQRDPGIFRGLPNGDNYCYLNTALQELYALPNFRKKVLECKIPEIDGSKTDEYEELRATKFFFEYLEYGNADFFDKRKEMAKKLGYNRERGNSVETKRNIETKCRDQMRKIKNKSPLELNDFPDLTLADEDIKGIKSEWQRKCQNFGAANEADQNKIAQFTWILLNLYKKQDIRERILKIDTEELNLKDSYDYLKCAVNIFKQIHENNTYSDNVFSNLLALAWIKQEKNVGYKTTVKKIVDSMNDFERSKKAHVLSKDSTITILSLKSTLIESLIATFGDLCNEKKAFYLPLKNYKFTITLTALNEPISESFVKENLDLSEMVRNGILKIFVKNEELKKDEYKFKLILASIMTGGHYYLYRKTNGGWKRFNDSSVENFKFENIQSDISQQCESLTYELIT